MGKGWRGQSLAWQEIACQAKTAYKPCSHTCLTIHWNSPFSQLNTFLSLVLMVCRQHLERTAIAALFLRGSDVDSIGDEGAEALSRNSIIKTLSDL